MKQLHCQFYLRLCEGNEIGPRLSAQELGQKPKKIDFRLASESRVPSLGLRDYLKSPPTYRQGEKSHLIPLLRKGAASP